MMPYLFLHQPAHERSEAEGEKAPRAEGFRAMLTRRLLTAEQGGYAELIREAMDNEDKARAAARATARREPTRHEQLERAAARAADGCRRAAAQCLRPSGT